MAQIIPALQASMFYNPDDPGRWPGLSYGAPLALALHRSSPPQATILLTRFRSYPTTLGPEVQKLETCEFAAERYPQGGLKTEGKPTVVPGQTGPSYVRLNPTVRHLKIAAVKTCPYCAHQNEDHAVVCLICHTELTPPTPDVDPRLTRSTE